LIEHYAGNMPTWMSPEQVRVLGVRDVHDDYAFKVADDLRASGVRVKVEAASEPLGSRIRKAKKEKVPYILVVGDDDVSAGTLGINARGSNDPERGVTLAQFRKRLLDEIARHGSPEDA
jgi:threonyl-tRNA synthetase